MQLFTMEQVFQMLIDANRLYSQILKAFFDVSFKEIFANIGIAFSSLNQGDWKTFVVSIVTLLGLIIFVYRLARKNLWVRLDRYLIKSQNDLLKVIRY